MVLSKEYRAIKNFVHNELGLSKEDFTVLMREAVKAEAKAFVQRKFQESDLKYEELAKIAIEKEAKSILTGRQHGTNADRMFSIIGKVVAEQFTIKLKQNEEN
jgi:hypothetical protein